MHQSRLFEQHIVKLFASGKMHGTTHLNMGQEACQVGLSLALQDNDWIVPTHRCHGYNIATGSSPFAMFSEMFGSQHGLCKGLGGSMHMSDKEHFNLGSSAVVASGVGLATGLAFAHSKLKNNNISVALFGDGASSRGIIHECMNMSSIWNLPVLFFLENNGYGMSTKSDRMISVTSIKSRVSAYGMEGEVVDGNNLEEVYDACKRARTYILENKRPYLIEAITYRYNGHSKSDPCVYRTRDEEKEWEKKDPIKRFKASLFKDNIISEETYDNILKEDSDYMESELLRAKEHKNEIVSMEQAQSYLYSPFEKFEEIECKSFHRAFGREAIREALLEEAQYDKNVYVIGEDIGIYGGCFKVTGDLHKKIKNQMIETPISEEGFAEIAIGASTLGIRPIVEIMYGDFATLISDALINHASKLRFMSAGQFNCPVVFRLPMGCGTGHGSQHSQSLESMFTNIPGLIMIAPSSPRKAKALLKSAVRNDNPVLFLEHKFIYNLNGEIGDETDLMEIGKCDIERVGNKLTLVSYGYMTQKCREAINLLVAEDIKYEGAVELVDLCTLKPLDNDTLIKSVKKTHNCLIVQEAPQFAGFGNEVAIVLNREPEIFRTLENPINVFGGIEMPIPFNPILEKDGIPTAEEIVKKIKNLLK
jgi:pyruvate/2-oxoglutarate/acetoin dehydrogenase E1 component/TPP-dependent pyruvate/acetoin dehydrogenase alpha subunit